MEDVLGIKNPRVGLVNVGVEEAKGNQLVKETGPLLKDVYKRQDRRYRTVETDQCF